MSLPAARSTAVVTVTFNSSDILDALFTSIELQSARPEIVVVVDNASADIANTAEIVAARGAVLIRSEKNLGYGGAVNLGVSSLPEHIGSVLIMNPDAFLHPGAVEELMSTLASSGRAASVGPLILNPDGGLYPSARNQPSLRTGLGHALFTSFWPANPWSRTYRQEFPSKFLGVREVGWLSGACLLVDRVAFASVGGFDERYFMYFEDVELGRRFLQIGRSNVYTPSAIVTHQGAHSTTESSESMIREHHRSAYRFLSARYSGPTSAPLRLALRLALGIRARLVVRANRSAAPRGTR